MSSPEGREGDIVISNSNEKFNLQKSAKNKFKNVIPLREADQKYPSLCFVFSGTGRNKPINDKPKIDSITTISSLDALSLRPALTTTNSVPHDKDKEDQAANFFSEEGPSLRETSTFGPSGIKFSPVHKPFRGFSGNIRQMTFVERLKGNTEGESSLNSIPGSDTNDDDHVLSFFQKKKGNVTNTLQ
ncbi:hypothetical protein Avbf_17581, partial [Armadillidium vulgare]